MAALSLGATDGGFTGITAYPRLAGRRAILGAILGPGRHVVLPIRVSASLRPSVPAGAAAIPQEERY
jgi:hypothetical protein